MTGTIANVFSSGKVAPIHSRVFAVFLSSFADDARGDLRFNSYKIKFVLLGYSVLPYCATVPYGGVVSWLV